MSAAMALIAEQASNHGAGSVLTYVRQDNVASLKGCQRAGFAPYTILENRWYAFGTIKQVNAPACPSPFSCRMSAERPERVGPIAPITLEDRSPDLIGIVSRSNSRNPGCGSPVESGPADRSSRSRA